MERYDRTGEEEWRSDPSQEWSAPGDGTVAEGLQGGGESYPERLDEPDCIYYLRTGVCGYGSRCRFNHPPDRRPVIEASRGERDFPERAGQPVCQHFMRTGTCRYGASCKYHHPRHGGNSYAASMRFNHMGYPLRPGEKECSYYMRTGQCKFGLTCRFHHPVPPAQPPVAMYTTVQSPSVPSAQQYGVVMPRPPIVPGSYVQSPFGPMVLPPGMVPYPGWNPYAGSSGVPSSGNQLSGGSSSIYGLTLLSPSAASYTGPYQSEPPSVGPSTTQKEQSFPQRPDQPECKFFMRTGDCKFGSSCRYHHPLDGVALKPSVILSSIGLPLRPGAPLCTHFAQHGICKFGPACKFDHSTGSLNYSSSSSSFTGPVGPTVATLDSSVPRPELISSSSRETAFPKTITSPSTNVTTATIPETGQVASDSTSVASRLSL